MFRILHISDLHARPKDQWSTAAILAEARPTLIKACETYPIDVVAFTGDIAFSGQKAEYDIAREWMEKVCLSPDGLNLDTDRLLFVPGNHDVDRSRIGVQGDALEERLKNATSQADVARVFNDGPSLSTLLARHEQYVAFVNQLTGSDSQGLPSWTRGFSYKGQTILFEGYCSSWLCRGEDDHRRLLIGQPQLTQRTSSREGTNPSLLVALVHHPLSDLKEFDELNCVSHFRAHHDLLLRGHLHNADVIRHHTGTGSYVEIAAGAFHEQFEARNKFNIIDIDDSLSELSVRTFTWERGRWIHDRNAFPDSDEGVGTFPLSPRVPKSTTLPAVPRLPFGTFAVTPVTTQSDLPADNAQATGQTSPGQDVLARFPRYRRKVHTHDMAIRHDSLERGLLLAESQRLVPVIAEWGASAHSFLSAFVAKLHEIRSTTIVLHASCSGVSTGEQLQHTLGQHAGVSSVDFASSVRESESIALILDDIALSEADRSDLSGSTIRETITAYLDYCPNLVIVTVTHKSLSINDSASNSIILRPLDSADTRSYLQSHSSGRVELESVVDYDRVQRVTGGLPRHIDAVVEALDYTDLDNALTTLDSTSGLNNADVPAVIIDAITRLATSSEDTHIRAYSMLSVLCILDHGETLKTIKRVEEQSPLWPHHAKHLEEAGLLDVVEQSPPISHSRWAIKVNKGEKVLRVPRVVRDYVLSKMDRPSRMRLLKAAANVYFGSDWLLGNIRPRARSTLFSLPSALSTGNELGVIRGLLLESLKADPERPCEPEQALRLGLRFVSYINSKGLYGEGYEAAREILGTVRDNHVFDKYVDERTELQILAGKCARMIGERSESVRLLNDALPAARASKVRGRLLDILSSLARAYEGLEQRHEAVKIAEEMISLSQNNSANYLEGKAIIANLEIDRDSGARQLQALLNRAQRHGHYTLADNIAIELASRAKSTDEALDRLAVVRTRKEREYNYVRATIRRTEALLSAGRVHQISDHDVSDMSVCYQLAFSQRLGGIFNWCHRVLWDLLEARTHHEGQLALFTHSSFFWRLHGENEKELEYAKKLCDRFPPTPIGSESTSRVIRYCRARVKALGPTNPVPAT